VPNLIKGSNSTTLFFKMSEGATSNKKSDFFKGLINRQKAMVFAAKYSKSRSGSITAGFKKPKEEHRDLN